MGHLCVCSAAQTLRAGEEDDHQEFRRLRRKHLLMRTKEKNMSSQHVNQRTAPPISQRYLVLHDVYNYYILTLLCPNTKVNLKSLFPLQSLCYKWLLFLKKDQGKG